MFLFISNDSSSLRTQHGPSGAGGMTCGRPQYISLGVQGRGVQEAANDAYLSQFFEWFQNGIPDEVESESDGLVDDALGELLVGDPAIRMWIVNGDTVFEIGATGLSETAALLQE
ncbi:MAG: hypothetical protein HQL53_02900 [Magnetococcales bacterium]|nr:hypothetical protein [Magnetococcales bacterium]